MDNCFVSDFNIIQKVVETFPGPRFWKVLGKHRLNNGNARRVDVDYVDAHFTKFVNGSNA